VPARRPHTVSLVGAGPGDPGLLTLKGADCIRRADVIVYDRLANPRLLDLARDDAELIDAGKKAGKHTLSQDGINALLVEKARAGKTVCRLKGGDPFVFGRGGEEALALAEAGVPFEVVPGVTSAVAAAAYAGIPVTHRGLASSVAFVAGSEDPAKGESSVDWPTLARGPDTLVLLMAARNLSKIADALVDNGRDPATPVAVVKWGTHPTQATIETTLDGARRPEVAAQIEPPAVVVVGRVASLRQQLAWFERRPLFGKRIVVTRPRAQSASLAAQLEALGADVIELPTIEISPLADTARLDAALRRLGSYDWVIFTSVNGVKACFERLGALGRDARAFGGVKVAAVGEATARELGTRGLVADLVPDDFTSVRIVKALGRRITGKRFLLPRADIAPDELPKALRARGARVRCVDAYATTHSDLDERVLEALAAGRVDMVTFTSASTVRGFVEGISRTKHWTPASKVVYGSIGPETTRAAEAHGLRVAVEAATHTADGLVEAVVAYFEHARETA
jgi:uroporphyrinogen III methyltransferase/synthase